MLHDIQIHIYSNKEIKNEANIKFYKTHTNYYKLIHNYDLAIISGGFIKFEILYLGIPTLYFTLKQHQTILAKYFSTATCCSSLNFPQKLNP